MRMPKEDNENLNDACDLNDALKEKLSPELYGLHLKHINALEKNWSDEIDFYYVEGFKLGLSIGIECKED